MGHICPIGRSWVKPFFKYMTSKQKTKSTVRNLKKENGDLTGNDTETANLLQQFFLSTFTHEDETTTPELPQDR